MKNYIFLFLSTLFLAFLAPDVIFMLLRDNYTFRLDYIFFAVCVPFALILPLIKPRFFTYLIFVIFIILDLVSFAHIFYFGLPLNPFAISLIWAERTEIIESALPTFPSSLSVIFSVLIPYILLFVIYAKSRTFGNIKGVIALFLSIVALGILPYKATFKTPKISNFMPKESGISLYNSLIVFSGYFFILLPKDELNLKKYEPYKVSQTDDNEPKNIVLILGESINATHMSLLGYKRQTTPLLEKLQKNDEYFYASPAISSSVLTRISMNMFFNITYEPDNIFHIASKETHLIKLAKKAGFKTFYISNQTISEMDALSPNDLDFATTKENHFIRSAKLGDMVLLELLDEKMNEFKSGKNLIIIHERSSHSPYESTYKAYEKAAVYPLQNVSNDEYRINSYDNSMIFNDYIIASIFEKFKNSSFEIPSYVFFLPDHGEAMGESLNGEKNGIFGHATLEKEVAIIPFISSFYGKSKPQEFYLNSLKNFYYPTHYEIGVLLARLLGFEIENKNITKDTYYINGIDLTGSAGYYEVKKENNKLEFIKR